MTDLVVGGNEGRFSRDPLPVFSAEGPCEQFWYGQGCPLFHVFHLAFHRRPRRRPPALKNGFGEAVVACDKPEACKFPSLDSCQKRTLMEVDLAPHPVVGLVLQVGDTEKSPHALGFESLDPFFVFCLFFCLFFVFVFLFFCLLCQSASRINVSQS